MAGGAPLAGLESEAMNDASAQALVTLEVALEGSDQQALAAADAALGSLREAFRLLDADERDLLAERVAPLRARRDGLAAQLREQDLFARLAGERPRHARPSRPLEDVLRQLGIGALRPGQPESIAAAMEGRDALIVMATGSGKSLCYQAPALALGGLTVVVSPLIALITDQFERLSASGAPVRMLSSSQSAEEGRDALAAISRGEVQVVFCAPERFTQEAFLEALAENRIDLFVVDEAHCLVEWGDDFRPEYARLGEWRDAIGARSTLALTATATPAVGAEIVRRLRLQDPLALCTGFDRPNITFDVVTLEGKGAVARKWDHLMAALRPEGATPAIVYCGTRRDTERVADGLRERGLDAVAYHAGLDRSERGRIQDRFMAGATQIICATNAFGMGVDKGDVRTVIHWALPTSLEGYYQEAGRAGRDGAPSRALLLAMKADRGRLIRFNRNDISEDDVDRLLERLHGQARGRELELEVMNLEEGERQALAIAHRVGALIVGPGSGATVRLEAISPRLDSAARTQAGAALRASRDRRWERYRAIVGYTEEPGCRRAAILAHFGDRRGGAPLGRCCDVCDPLPEPPPGLAAGRSGQKAGDSADERWGALCAWRSERAGGRPLGSVCSDASLRAIHDSWPRSQTELAHVTGLGPLFAAQHAASLLELTGAQGAPPQRSAPGLDDDGRVMFARLREWRRARAEGKPAYTVCRDAALEAIVRQRPQDLDALGRLEGIGPGFLARHGEALLAEIAG